MATLLPFDSAIMADRLSQMVPAPLLFATLSGAHLYGFPSPRSDFDVRGAFWLPPESREAMNRSEKTIEQSFLLQETEVDLVIHEMCKYLQLIGRGTDGYVLEQVLSPLVIVKTPFLQELRDLVRRRGFSRKLYRHYRGFSTSKRREYEAQEKKQLKTVLYALRVMATATFLFETGLLEANLLELNRDYYEDSVVERLIFSQRLGVTEVPPSLLPMVDETLDTFDEMMEAAFAGTFLPESVDMTAELNALAEKADAMCAEMQLLSPIQQS